MPVALSAASNVSNQGFNFLLFFQLRYFNSKA